MERHAFAFKTAEGRHNAFRRTLGSIWGAVTGLLDELEVSNFSLWNVSDLVFGYYETEGKLSLSPEQQAVYRDILYRVEETGEWISSPSQEMRLMYEDFGIVRLSKELIRHRVFATNLRGDLQEEYKRRHDVLHDELLLARNGEPNPGPGSNVSIWNAGRYIFGYEENDVTMEEEPTEDSIRKTIEWETKMLEIMEWYTDEIGRAHV